MTVLHLLARQKKALYPRGFPSLIYLLCLPMKCNHSNFLLRLRERPKAVGTLENHTAVTENDVMSTILSECLIESHCF